jgi:hypothetical protein
MYNQICDPVKLKTMGNQKINITEVKRFIDQRLYNFTGTEALVYAWNTGENVLLTGPGGYGKSEGAVLFSDYLRKEGIVENVDPFIMSFGQGTTEEKILGGIDMKKFQDEGDIIYLLKNSFATQEVVIFEELFDAFAGVLLVLKDILQAKEVRMGNQRLPLKTKIIIACTNREHDEIIEDQSTEALLQRFAFSNRVCWESWTRNDYTRALDKGLNGSNQADKIFVAKVCAAIAEGEYKPSPRQAFKALRSVVINGFESIQFMYGFNHSATTKIVQEYRQQTFELAMGEQIRNVREVLRSLTYTAMQAMKPSEIMNIMGDLQREIVIFDHNPIGDQNLEMLRILKAELSYNQARLVIMSKIPEQARKGWVRDLMYATEAELPGLYEAFYADSVRRGKYKSKFGYDPNTQQ